MTIAYETSSPPTARYPRSVADAHAKSFERCHIVFDDKAPEWMPAPPVRPCSTTMTLLPRSCARIAAAYPAGPAPSTQRSHALVETIRRGYAKPERHAQAARLPLVHPAFDGDPAWRVHRTTPDGLAYVIRPVTP